MRGFEANMMNKEMCCWDALSHAHVQSSRLCAAVDTGSTGRCYDVVDIYDGKLDKWHTAQLSLARHYLSAASLPSQGLALFAGGDDSALLWM